MLETFTNAEWSELFTDQNQQRALHKLENGHVLFFPNLPFALAADEKIIFNTGVFRSRLKEYWLQPHAE